MKKKIAFIGFMIAIVLLVRPYVHQYQTLHNHNRAIGEISIDDVDISSLEDGVYEGFYETVLVQALVTVEVEGGEIVEIDLDHTHERGYGAHEIIERVKEEQSLVVDMISGATDSSKTILEAIQRAIIQ